MGNCLEVCFGARPRSRDYFRGRYRNCDVGIEFENLMEDDSCQVDGNPIITHEERELLNDHMYTELIAAQRKIDAEIDEKLQREEEEIKLEEEAFIAAKREASRIARQKRLIDAEQNALKHTSTGSWLGDDESQWEVAGGQDDFEMFLESVKARSLTVRSNGMHMNDEQSVSPPEFDDKTGYSSKKDQTVSSDEASWEGNFVNADMIPEPIVIPASVSAANHTGITTSSMITGLPTQTAVKSFNTQQSNTLNSVDSNISSAQNKSTPKTAKSSVLDSSLKDFDDFLDELELELDLSVS